MQINETSLKELKAQLDTEVKKMLAQKTVLAWILRRNVREFAGMDTEEVIRCIEGEPEIGTKPVNPGETNTEITGMNCEDCVEGEGKLYYDILFYVKVPREADIMKMIINVEAQKSFYPGYHIETRAVFYASREISAQKHTEFEKSDYDSIKKVYSIWLCMNAPDYIGNAISEYIFSKNDLLPGIPDRKDAYDKIAVVIVTLNEKSASSDEFINLMNMLTSDTMCVEDKKKRLENDFGITVRSELEGSVNVMCNYSDMIEEKGIKKGTIQVAQRMLKSGKYNYEEIADITELSIEEIKHIEMEMTVTI